jgi:hypothetical protein
MNKITQLLIGLIVSTSGLMSQDYSYFDENEPTEIPQVFSAGKLCLKDRFEMQFIMSNDSQTAFLVTSSGRDGTGRQIVYISNRIANNTWTPFDTLSVSKRMNMRNISVKDNALIFSSDFADKRFINHSENIWKLEDYSTNEKPVLIEYPINTALHDMTPYFVKENVLYFSRREKHGFSIYRYNAKENILELQIIGESSAGRNLKTFPCVPKNEEYLIYVDFGEKGTDLYICFNEGYNKWSEPKSMELLENIEGGALNPMISKNGKYLFFTVQYNDHDGDIYRLNLDMLMKKMNN